jgi:hypothetical protein
VTLQKKYFSNLIGLFIYLCIFPTPPIKLKLGLQRGEQCSVCDPCKNISHIPGLFIYLFNFFFNSTHKTKIGTANRWHTTKTKPRGPIRNREQQSDHFKYTLLCQVLGFAVPYYQPQAECAKLLGPKPFCWAKLACFVVLLLLL